MQLVAGIVLLVAAIAAFFFSLPRNGKVAGYVGSQWEGYVVAGIIGFAGIGAVMIVAVLA